MENLDEARSRRSEPRLRALWILAIVLVGAGLLLTVGLQLFYANQIVTDPGPIGQVAITMLQVGGALGPSLLTAGLLSASLALASGAVLDRMTSESMPPSATIAPPRDDMPDDDSLDPQDVILGTTERERRRYMRPAP